MEDKVSSEVKHRRFDELVEVLAKDIAEKAEAYVGKIVSVLVEGASKKNGNMLTGYSDTQKLVNFKGNPEHVGKIVPVLIKEAHTYSLIGEEVDG